MTHAVLVGSVPAWSAVCWLRGGLPLPPSAWVSSQCIERGCPALGAGYNEEGCGVGFVRFPSMQRRGTGCCDWEGVRKATSLYSLARGVGTSCFSCLSSSCCCCLVVQVFQPSETDRDLGNCLGLSVRTPHPTSHQPDDKRYFTLPQLFLLNF